MALQIFGFGQVHTAPRNGKGMLPEAPPPNLLFLPSLTQEEAVREAVGSCYAPWYPMEPPEKLALPGPPRSLDEAAAKRSKAPVIVDAVMSSKLVSGIEAR